MKLTSRETFWILSSTIQAFQIVLLAYDRPWSMLRCLTSLRDAHYPVNLEIPFYIRIDRRADGSINEQVVEFAEKYQWSHGEKTVLAQEKHQGLLGQWLSIPPSNNYQLIMEDDIIVSPFYYRILAKIIKKKALPKTVWAVTLQRPQWQMGSNEHGRWRRLDQMPSGHPMAFLMEAPATWALLILPGRWQKLLTYAKSFLDQGGVYTKGAITTKWVKERGQSSLISPLIYEYLRHNGEKILFFYSTGRKVLASARNPVEQDKKVTRSTPYEDDELIQDPKLIETIENLLETSLSLPEYTGCLDLMLDGLQIGPTMETDEIVDINVIVPSSLGWNVVILNRLIILRYLRDVCRQHRVKFITAKNLDKNVDVAESFNCNQKNILYHTVVKAAMRHDKRPIYCPYVPGLYPHLGEEEELTSKNVVILYKD